MGKSIAVKQKKRGRPATGHDPFVGIRLPEALLEAIKGWSDKHGVNTRSEAIRRLVELGLTTRSTKTKQAPTARADRAKELASQAIDKLGDPAAHPEERAQRRHRLTKGPEEFREARVDRPKTKGSPK
jgi:Arc/MetJ-type ribon-helix-helix transcriptional regulator